MVQNKDESKTSMFKTIFVNNTDINSYGRLVEKWYLNHSNIHSIGFSFIQFL